MPKPKIDILDFAIIGGGIAGLYTAWRIANSEVYKNKSIHLFEATQKTGGRLLSVKMPGIDFIAELGGMRYTSNHILLRKTIQKLQLKSRPFSFVDRQMYLRGRHLKMGAMADGACDTCHSRRGMPYQLEKDEPPVPVLLTKKAIASALRSIQFDYTAICKNDGNTKEEILLTAATLASLPADGVTLSKSTLTCRQWALLKQYGMIHQRPLYSFGFWNLLQHFLSSEAFLLVHDGLGYESLFANWNAAEAIPCFLSDFGVDYFTVTRGLNAVPDRLLATLLKEPTNFKLHNCHRLKSIRIDSKAHDAFRLTFQINESETGVNGAGNNGNTSEVRARRLILALPRVAMIKACRDLSIDGEFGIAKIRKFKKTVADSVKQHPLFKLFLAYDSAWWADPRVLGATSGRLTTDLPIRQVYYYSAARATRVKANQADESVEEFTKISASRGVLMASYSDEHYVDFWHPLVRNPGQVALPVYSRDCDIFSKLETASLDAWGITEPLMAKAHRQICSLYPEVSELGDIPKPYVGLAMDWSRKPFYGGWHSWNPHAQSWEVVPELAQPFGSEMPLFTCGEAFSTEQGWVEGALKSAELVLEKLKVESPSFTNDELTSARCNTSTEYFHEGRSDKI
jgi:lysine 2-monooxygenase